METHIMTIDATLEDRKKTHGEFADHARVTQAIKRAMEDSPNWAGLPDIMKESLEMDAHKVGRILTGDPFVLDHWIDRIGYARLVEQRVDGKQVVPFAEPEQTPAAATRQHTAINGTPVVNMTEEQRATIRSQVYEWLRGEWDVARAGAKLRACAAIHRGEVSTDWMTVCRAPQLRHMTGSEIEQVWDVRIGKSAQDYSLNTSQST